jgi:ATP phosphoribosyltransferase
LRVIFQRPGDIVVGVQQGSLDIGITGLDIVAEKRRPGSDLLVIHEALGYGRCRLVLAVPEAWSDVQQTVDLRAKLSELGNPEGGLRVATKFPHLTGQHLTHHDVNPVRLIEAEGTLEVAPAVGYADLVADLVSTGTTLRDNRLRPLDDGTIIESQAVLIGNRASLSRRPEALELVRQMLEFVEAHQRGEGHYSVVANVRGDSGSEIARRMLDGTQLTGLQGPTIAPVYHPNQNGQRWFAVNIVVPQERLSEAIAELRHIGGSGVIVSPVTYIFEEEPARFQKLVAALAITSGAQDREQ